MMINKNLGVKWLTLFLFSIALLFSIGSVHAYKWSCIHGHSGNIEYPSRVHTLERVHIGWGLDFQLNPGMSNWIHFAPPSAVGQQTRYIALQFFTGSADAFIDSVHVYDLGTKIAEFNDLGWSGDTQVQKLDLGSVLNFNVLGIAVEVKAGVESMSHRILFTGACASVEEPE